MVSFRRFRCHSPKYILYTVPKHLSPACHTRPIFFTVNLPPFLYSTWVERDLVGITYSSRCQQRTMDHWLQKRISFWVRSQKTKFFTDFFFLSGKWAVAVWGGPLWTTTPVMDIAVALPKNIYTVCSCVRIEFCAGSRSLHFLAHHYTLLHCPQALLHGKKGMLISLLIRAGSLGIISFEAN